MSSFRECCTAKYPLREDDSAAYLVHRSNAALGRAVCFLGRFLPKLGGAASTAIFLLGAAPGSVANIRTALPLVVSAIYGDLRVKIQFSARASRLRDDRARRAFLICNRSGGKRWLAHRLPGTPPRGH